MFHLRPGLLTDRTPPSGRPGRRGPLPVSGLLGVLTLVLLAVPVVAETGPPPSAPGAPEALAREGAALVAVPLHSSGVLPEAVTVTADPGGASCSFDPSGLPHVCLVEGLDDGVEYTFTAVASNGSAVSEPSGRSDPVVPRPAFAVEFERAVASGSPLASVASPDGSYVYVSHDGYPSGRVDKLRTSDLVQVGSVTLSSSDQRPTSMVISPDGANLYIGGSPSRATGFSPVTRVRTSDMVRTGSVNLSSGESNLTTAVIDPDGEYAYFSGYYGLNSARVVKVRLSDMTRMGAVSYGLGSIPGVSNWDRMALALMDPDGEYAYFISDTDPAAVFRIRLSDFTAAGRLTLHSDAYGRRESNPRGATVSPDGDEMLIFTGSFPGWVVRVDLTDLSAAGSTSSSGVAPYGWSHAHLDPDGLYAYVRTAAPFSSVDPQYVKVRTSDAAYVATLDVSDLVSARTSAAAAGADRVFQFGSSSGAYAAASVRLFDMDVSLPGPVSAVSATAGDRQVTLSWHPPGYSGGLPVIGYLVEMSSDGGPYGPAGGGCSREATSVSAATSCTVEGLAKSTPVSFGLTALTAAGPSEEVVYGPLLPLGPPDAPYDVELTASVRSLTASWEAPADDGQSPILSYEATASPGGGSCTVEPPDTSCTIVGLDDGVAYEVVVSAVNAVGRSPASASVSATTPAPPSAPVVTSVTAASRQVTVMWEPPDDDGGLDVLSYTATASPDGASCTVTAVDPDAGPSAGLECAVGGLTPGGRYSFTVTAANAAGEGPASEASQEVQVPREVQTITVMAPPVAVFGSTFTVSAASDSGLPVALEVSGVCSLDDASGMFEVTMTSGSGECLLSAAQAGDSEWLPASAAVVVAAGRAAQATLTLDAPSTLVYGASYPLAASGGSGSGGLSFSVSSGCTVASAEDGPVLTATASSGACTVSAAREGDADFLPEVVQATVDLSPAVLTVDAEDVQVVFGDADADLGWTLSGFAFDDAMSAVSGAADCSREPGSGVGAYVVSCAAGTLSADDYVFTAGGQGLYTVVPRPVTVRAGDVTFRHGGQVPEVGYVMDNLAPPGVEGGSDVEVPPMCRAEVDGTASPGVYSTVCSDAYDPSYTFSYLPGTAVVSEGLQEVAFTLPDVQAVFGGSFDVAPAASSGLPVTVSASGGCTAALSDGGSSAGGAAVWSVQVTSGTTACTLTASQEGDVDWAAAVPVVRTVATVRAAQPPLTFELSGLLVFGADVMYTAAGGAGSGGYNVTLSGGCRDEGSGVLSVTSGTVPCRVSVLRDGDDDHLPEVLELEVSTARAAQSPLSLEVPDGVFYGDRFEVTVSGGSAAAAPSVSGSGACRAEAAVDGPAGMVTPVVTTGAGECSLSVSLAGDDDFLPATAAGMVAVARATLTLSAEPVEAVYGDPEVRLRWGLSGFIGEDGPSDVSGVPVCSRTSGSAVGSYLVSCAAGTLSSDDYLFRSGSTAWYRIVPRVVTVRASDVTFRYGAQVPQVTATLENLAPGELTVDVLPVCTLSADVPAAPEPGVYSTVCSAAADVSYLFVYEDGTAVVEPGLQTLTVSAVPAQVPALSTFEVEASASSGLPAALSVSGGCALSASSAGSWTVAAVSAPSSCVLRFSQPGGRLWAAAETVTVMVATVAPAVPQRLSDVPAIAPGMWRSGSGPALPAVRSGPDDGYVVLRSDGVELVVPLTSDGLLPSGPGGVVDLTGSGLLPGSLVSAVMFSDPVVLGTAEVDGAGGFVLEATVPEDVPAGRHTLRMSGVAAAGALMVLEVGVEVPGYGSLRSEADEAGGPGSSFGAAGSGSSEAGQPAPGRSEPDRVTVVVASDGSGGWPGWLWAAVLAAAALAAGRALLRVRRAR